MPLTLASCKKTHGLYFRPPPFSSEPPFPLLPSPSLSFSYLPLSFFLSLTSLLRCLYPVSCILKLFLVTYISSSLFFFLSFKKKVFFSEIRSITKEKKKGFEFLCGSITFVKLLCSSVESCAASFSTLQRPAVVRSFFCRQTAFWSMKV